MDDDSESDVDPSSDEDLEDEDMVPERVFRHVFLIGDRVRLSQNVGLEELRGATGTVVNVGEFVRVHLDVPLTRPYGVMFTTKPPHDLEHLRE